MNNQILFGHTRLQRTLFKATFWAYMILYWIMGKRILGIKIKDIRKKFNIDKCGRREQLIIAKYIGKPLTISGYGGQDFFVQDLTEDYISTNLCVSEIDSGESHITQDGIDFLKEYYGYDKLAQLLYYSNDGFPSSSVEENRKWLESLESPFKEY